MNSQKEKQICLRIVRDREAYDLRTALEKLQDDYIAASLRNVPIRSADIPGVMPLVKERLAAHGITKLLRSMRWLGEIPTRALLAWRASVEEAVCASMPRRLPPDQIAQIRARYDALRRKIAEEGIQT